MRIALLFCVLVAGCATAVSEKDCRSGEWYSLGERDALAGISRKSIVMPRSAPSTP